MTQETYESTSQKAEIPVVDMLRAMRTDCVTFFAFYLGESLTLEVPEFHQRIWGELLELIQTLNQRRVVEYLRKLFAVPREHAKSTIAKLAAILFLKYSDLAFVLYVSKTNGIAKNAIRDIIIWLQSENEARLFGPCGIYKSSETDSLWIVDITIRDDQGTAKVKRCIFRALGSEQQVRGLLILNRRPEIIIIDDVEDLDNTRDDDQQKTLDEWVIGSLMKARAKRAIVLFLGNVIRKTTLIARLMKDTEWNPTVFGALVRNTITKKLEALWEGRHSVTSLLKDYADHKRLGVGYIWEYEMMNLTADEVMATDMGDIRLITAQLPENLTAGALILDPAFGLNAWNDFSAITVHAKIKDLGVPAVIDSRVGQWNENRVFDEMLQLSYYYGIYTWFIESVAAQKLLIGMFDLLIQTRGLPREMILLLPISGGQNSKASRILAFRESVRAKSYAIADTQVDLLTALGEYDPNSKAKDDLPDSAAYGTTIWAQHERTITLRGIQRIPMSAYGAGSSGDGKNVGQNDLCPF